jgi:hypothetical protein
MITPLCMIPGDLKLICVISSLFMLIPELFLVFSYHVQLYIEYFPGNLGRFSEEQGERFHQDIKEMEKRYQGRWNEHMMADCCWMLNRDCKEKDVQGSQKRGSLKINRSLFLFCFFLEQ